VVGHNIKMAYLSADSHQSRYQLGLAYFYARPSVQLIEHIALNASPRDAINQNVTDVNSSL